MLEINEDLFLGLNNSEVNAILITTNGFVKNNGRLVMGRGCALRARDCLPDIDLIFGTEVSKNGNHVNYVYNHTYDKYIISFPVKYFWRDPAELWLIERSCQELLNLTNEKNWKNVWMVQPGTGNGSLNWVDVKPILIKYLDDRFTICSLD